MNLPARLWARLRKGAQPVRTSDRDGDEATAQRKNLLVFHFESVSWQTVNSLPEAFPNLTALIAEARTYRRHYSSATSTLMVLAALLHANDFEMDTAQRLAPPDGNNPSLFSVLRQAGYSTEVLCATPLPGEPILQSFSQSLPPVWKSNDFAALLSRFDEHASSGPFAVHVWSQIPHMVSNIALAAYAEGLDDLVAGACAVADTLLGELLDILRRKGILDDTTIVVFGDHGDDYYTHGFKNGLLHAVEPNTALVNTPLIIRDSSLAKGVDMRLASTIDVGPTCLELLGLPYQTNFPHSGASVVGAVPRAIAFSQNFTARQPDWKSFDVRKSFAAIDASHILMVTHRGLELFNHRLDPTNQANILHHFDMDAQGRLDLPPLRASVHPHFHTIHHMWRGGSLQESFETLRNALKAHVEAKNDHACAKNSEAATGLLNLSAFDQINREGRSIFFNTEGR
jgi:hypothetical protein